MDSVMKGGMRVRSGQCPGRDSNPPPLLLAPRLQTLPRPGWASAVLPQRPAALVFSTPMRFSFALYVVLLAIFLGTAIVVGLTHH